jgi:Do/DeqQ family serine protease
MRLLPVFAMTLVVLTVGLTFAPLSRAQVPVSQGQISLSFAPVVKTAAPAVVNIYTTTLVPTRRNPFAGDPFFEQFFQSMATPARRQNSLGSGVIVSPDGLVISNNHVTQGADEIRVVLHDRREFAARVLLADEASDLAVLQLDGAAELPALTLADSDALQVGDLVLAIGNPFGVGQTVSSGIVSGLARSALQVGNGQGYFVQTDAPINPGNSGGALVNMGGELIGINTAIVTQGGGSNGIGFAVPSNLVAAVLDQARAGAAGFARPWAGVTGQEVDAATAEGLGMPYPEGVLLADIDPASPFATAGVQTGDIVLTLDGKPVNTPQEMIFRLSILGIGATVALTWDHEGEIRQGEVTLIAPPETPARAALTITQDVVLRGLSLARINPAVRVELGLPPQAQGVVVTGSEDLAARIGLQAGDVLLTINGRRVTRPSDALTIAAEPATRWQIEVLRDGQQMRLRFRL